MTQEPALRAISAQARPRGRCLNAGSGKICRYSGFLESYGEIDEIVNLDIVAPEASALRSDPRHVDVQGSVTEMPFADSSFDWLLCTNVLLFVDDDRVAAGELARVLKPGAHAVIAVATRLARADPRWSTREAQGLPRLRQRSGYSLDELSDLLAEAGLEVVAHRYDFRRFMQWFSALWRWHFVRIGRGRQSFMPRAAALLFGYLDRWLPLGAPSDLVVLARKAS